MDRNKTNFSSPSCGGSATTSSLHGSGALGLVDGTGGCGWATGLMTPFWSSASGLFLGNLGIQTAADMSFNVSWPVGTPGGTVVAGTDDWDILSDFLDSKSNSVMAVSSSSNVCLSCSSVSWPPSIHWEGSTTGWEGPGNGISFGGGKCGAIEPATVFEVVGIFSETSSPFTWVVLSFATDKTLLKYEHEPKILGCGNLYPEGHEICMWCIYIYTIPV